MERTFAMVKPDAVAAGHLGPILTRIHEAGFRVMALRMAWLSTREAEGFYAVHRERPFFRDLVSFMTSGPAVLMVLEAPDAIRRWRTLMGATDPAEAAEGTLRRTFAESKQRNAVHGSDAPDTARQEVAWFFPESTIF